MSLASVSVVILVTACSVRLFVLAILPVPLSRAMDYYILSIKNAEGSELWVQNSFDKFTIPSVVLTNCLNLHAELIVEGFCYFSPCLQMTTHPHDSVLQPDWSRQIPVVRSPQYSPPNVTRLSLSLREREPGNEAMKHPLVTNCLPILCVACTCIVVAWL